MDLAQFNRAVIAEFRANGGKVGGDFAGRDLLILTTRGAKSGLERVNPLVYLTDGDRYVVIASFAGAPRNPPWFHNLVANPHVGVELGRERFAARAQVLAEPDRSRLYARAAEVMPVFTEYQAKTARTIPVIALTRVSAEGEPVRSKGGA